MSIRSLAAFLVAVCIVLAVAGFAAPVHAAPQEAPAQGEPEGKCCGRSDGDLPEPTILDIQTSAEKAGEDPVEAARMRRMSANLLKPQLKLAPEAAARQRAEWVRRFQQESNPLFRQEIITEMVQLDDAKTLEAMMGVFDSEPHGGVREQIILIIGYMRATAPEMAKVSKLLTRAYERRFSAAERSRILEVVSNLPTPESVAFMKKAITMSGASAQERSEAAQGLFKLAPRVKVPDGLLRHVTDRLKHDAQFAPTPHERRLAAAALASPGQDHKAFFKKLLVTEKHPELRNFLKLAAEQYPTR